MSLRMKGALLLARALAPAIALAVIAVSSIVAMSSVRDSAEDYQEAVNGELAVVEGYLETAGAAVEEVGIYLEGVGSAISGAWTDLQGLAGTEVTLFEGGLATPEFRRSFRPIFGVQLRPLVIPSRPLVQPGGVTVALPGADQIRGFFESASASAATATQRLRCGLRSLAWIAGPVVTERLQELEPPCVEPEAGPVGRIITANEAFRADVADVAWVWLWVALAGLALGVVGWLATNAAIVVGDLRRGWAMLRGRTSAPPPTMEDLARRVGQLENALERTG